MTTHRFRSLRALLRWAVVLGVLACVAVVVQLTLSKEETPHAEHPDPIPSPLVVGVIGESMMPLEGVSDDKLTGFSGDLLLQLIPQDRVQIVPRVFTHRDELLNAACTGEVDVILSVVPRSRYDLCLNYSAPYLERSTAAVTRTSDAEAAHSPFSDDARVAIEQGTALEDDLARQYPRVRLISFPTPAEALQAVVDGTASAYVGISYPTRALLMQPRYRTLSVAQPVNQPTDALYFAAPRRNNALIRYLDRQLAQLPNTTVRDLRARWFTLGEASDIALPLSAPEQARLATLPPLRYAADAAYMPYTFDEQRGELRGMLPEYLGFLSRSLGLRFERVPVRDWAEALSRAQAGDIDILLGLSDQDYRPPGFLLSHPIDSTPMVIVGRTDAVAVAKVSELSGKTVALPMSETLADVLHKTVPKIRIEPADSVDDALGKVAAGRADFTIANLPVADALIRHHFPGELKVTGPADATERIGVGVASRYASLLPLINRALSAMPEGEQIRIRNKWQTVSYELGPSPWAVLAKFGPVIAIVVGVLVLLFIKHLQLRRENRRRREAEATLEQQLNFQRALMESVPVPLMAKDAQHRYVAVNAAFCDLFGQTREAVLGRTPMQLGLYSTVSTLQASHLEDIHRRAIELHESSREELILTVADGRPRNALYWVEPFRMADGHPGGSVASLIDISEIREAQARAERLQQRLREITGSLPVLVYQFEMTPGHDEGRVVYAVGKAHETLGVQTDDVLSYLSKPEWLIHEADHQRVQDAVILSAKTLSTFDQQFRHVCDDGSIRWLRARSIPHRAADGRVIWNGYMNDMTAERAQAEALEAAKNAAESALRAKDRFLAMMSHEIRTPMNGVLGLVELLQQTRLDSEQTQMVSLVEESGRALLHILDDILDYAKIEAGHLAITPAPTDLRDLFDSTVGLLASRAHEKGLSVQVDVGANVPATVSVDSVRVRQILFNLLSNAIKFTDHGSVRLAAECLQTIDGTASLAIKVVDTGIGIAPEVQTKLFAPFVQAEHTTTRRYGGTGLGLAISRQLAKLMGGTLDMQSTPNVGTAITLRLEAAVLAPRHHLPHLDGATVRIDVSDAAGRHGLEQFATAAGMRVANTATPALTLADEDSAPARAARTVRVTREALQLGRDATPTNPRLSTNPLNWRTFLQVCEAALSRPAGAEYAATPAEAADAVRTAVSAPVEPLGAHILVAEDHPINRELIARQLRLLGYRVTLAEDGIAALEHLRETHFDALLTDCHMPGMDGFDLAEHIRRHEAPTGMHLPIVAITATTLAEEHARCRAVGMDACLLKPTTLASLQEALSALVHPAGAQPARAPGHTAAPPSAANETLALNADNLRRVLGEGTGAASLVGVFLSALDEDAAQLRTLLKPVDRQALRQWVHRTGGALALLRNPALDAAMTAFQRTVRSADDPEIQRSGERMACLLGRLKSLVDTAKATL